MFLHIIGFTSNNMNPEALPNRPGFTRYSNAKKANLVLTPEK